MPLTRSRTMVFLLAVAATHTVLATAEAEVEGAKTTTVASVEGITEYRLANGLRFLLFPDQSKQQITVNITYLVGSRHEGYGETGMAHLLEHLLFKGSKRHPEIVAELSMHAGSDWRGVTRSDRTCYYETFPANEDNLAWALDLEADRMVNSFVAQRDLDSEMTVVRNEWEKRENDPLEILAERVSSTAYLWHNYGKSPIGARADIENVPLERLRAFYRKYYQPDNAVLIVAGRFDPARAIELIEKKFGAIPKPDRQGANRLFATYTAEPPQDGERSVTLRRVGDVQLAMAAYHVPAGSHEQFAAVEVLSRVLANRLSNRVVKTRLAAGAAIGALRHREPGLLVARVDVRSGDELSKAAQAMLETLQSVAEEPPTEDEVQHAKRYLANKFDDAFTNPHLFVSGLSEWADLSEWAATGDWRLFFLHRDRVAAVTPALVQEAARVYLIPSNRTLGYFYPTDEPPPRAAVPPPPDVAVLVENYRGRAAVTEGKTFDPTPANIDRRTRVLVLDNGVEVALLAKRNRGQTVHFDFSFPHGTEKALAGKAIAGEFALRMLRRSTSKRTSREIRAELVRLNLKGGLNGDALSVGGSLSTVRGSLPAALRLIGEQLRQPAFDASEFELEREKSLEALEAQLSDPAQLVRQAMSWHLASHYAPDHVLYEPTLDEKIARTQAVTVAEARDFWSAFYGAEGGTLAIVGDFDPDEILPVIEEVFADWRADQPYQRVERPFADVTAVDVDIETPDKTNAIMLAGQTIRMKDDHPDYPALVLAEVVLGSYLSRRLREPEGWSYKVESQLDVRALDDSAKFTASATFAPENADKVVAAFKQEMECALELGFTEKVVKRAKRAYLNSAHNARANDLNLASALRSNLVLNRTMAFVEQQEAAIAALTPAAIHDALRRHIDMEKMSIFRGGDFQQATAMSPTASRNCA